MRAVFEVPNTKRATKNPENCFKAVAIGVASVVFVVIVARGSVVGVDFPFQVFFFVKCLGFSAGFKRRFNVVRLCWQLPLDEKREDEEEEATRNE